QLGARSQPFGGKFGGALAHAARDVVLRDDEVFAGVVLAAQDDVGVRVVGVPVIDRDPLQARAQVGFHAVHQVAGVAPQVVQLGGIFRRDDEAELVPVVAAAFLEGGQVCVVGRRAVRLPRLAVAADTFALDVAQVRDGRARTGLLEIHQPHLDGGAARVRGERLPGEARGDVAAPQPRAGCLAALAAGDVGRL